MQTPAVYGPFHLLTAVLGSLAACWLAVCLKRKGKKYADRIYLITGIVLCVSELYKQLFNYYIVNDHQYMLYLLPFQLCSLPMYLCILIPFIRSKRLKRSLNTFLVDFNLMGAVMVFADPSGIFYPYWTLTLHGVFWHLIVIFIGLYAGLSGFAASDSLKGYLKALPIFAVCCAIALCINYALHPYGGANMFYIDPYAPSVQIVFRDISRIFGIWPGIISYIAAMALGGFVCHLIFYKLYKAHHLQDKDPHRQCDGR